MPELPEVETIKRSLEPLLVGRKIAGVTVNMPVVIAHPNEDIFTAALCGSEIKSLGRRGKFLQIFLDNGQIVIHLRMTGKVVLVPAGGDIPKHTHVIFNLDNEQELHFNDVRRFGRVWYIENNQEDIFTGMAKLGPEPFADEFGPVYLKEKLKNRKVNIKQALLDQSVIAGLGNIYVDEVLFACGISPLRNVRDLKDKEWLKLALAIPNILEESIKRRGTSFRDYRDGLGQKGENESNLKVYQRKSQPCYKCGEIIQHTTVAQRSTFYCPKCQR